jgi:hypothetical protein
MQRSSTAIVIAGTGKERHDIRPAQGYDPVGLSRSDVSALEGC